MRRHEHGDARFLKTTYRRSRHLTLGAAVVVLATVAMALQAFTADDYPNRPIRVLIGPSSDVALRLVAEGMHRSIGQPLVIESRPGGGGEVAAKAVAAADPDGYTLLYATSSYTLNTALHYAGYDFVNEFEPIALFGISSFTLVVSPKVPAKSVKELIDYAKAHPGEINCASSGVGTPPHLGCEMFNAMAGVKTVHVPFRNVNAAINALLSGYVQMFFAVSINGRPQIESGALRGLAVTTPERTKIAPELPPMQETIPGFVITGWGSLVAPAKTPKPIVAKLNHEIIRVLRDPAFGGKVAATGQEPTEIETPEQFRNFIKEDIDRWNKLIDQAGVSRGKP
jgi:tripartite-type tricarboxylate transporter receptor subunit TctC